jgi:hypothetical protein
MLFAFDLWNYDQVVQHVDQILSRVGADMPPVSQGGPWPEEWVGLLQRWRDTGFKRLELGTAQYSWSQTATANVITADGNFPAAGYRGWLQIESETQGTRLYVLFFERPDVPQAAGNVIFKLRERYPLTETRSISVRDANGLHTVH